MGARLGAAQFFRGLKQRGHERFFGGGRQRHHREAVGKRSVRLAQFMRGNVRHDEVHPVQLASFHRRTCYGDVTAMHWIESPAEKSDIHVGFNPA